MLPRPKNLPGHIIHKDCTNRKSSAQTFCKCNNIGTDMLLLTAKKRTRSSDTGLHFIYKKLNTIFHTDFFHILCIAFIYGRHTALALHKLNHDPAYGIINGLLQLLSVSCLRIPKSLFSRPYFLATLIAPSFASAPELPKKTFAYSVSRHSRSASSTSGIV